MGEGEEEINRVNRVAVSRLPGLEGEPRIISWDKSSALARAVKQIIKRSAPFEVFPESKNKQKETYEILLVF